MSLLFESGEVYSLSEALVYCRRLVRCNYENFSVVSFLLPRKLREPMEVVYAYCRYSDDLGDNNNGSKIARETALEKLTQWEHELDQCFNYARKIQNTNPNSDSTLLPNDLPIMHPIFVALADVVRRFNLPKEPFANLLIAFKQDQIYSSCFKIPEAEHASVASRSGCSGAKPTAHTGFGIKQQYESINDLLGYCCNSANPVGRIVLYLAFNNGVEVDGKLLDWSDSICTGLQLANFWQDISRDFSIGRCYIPCDVAARYGVNIGQLDWSEEFRLMMCELVADARERILYGVPLIDEVPSSIKFDLALIIRGGLAILDAIKNINYNVLKKRPTVSRLKKINIAITTLLGKKIKK
ncbi:MAG: squalene/phytoene synthase family protein [Planctomycetaceae bacterium]|jgi:phytoene/squalene synthetase|nr:squalene/phytoene synthase family protein [Planctomycetaceae bacterium]